MGFGVGYPMDSDIYARKHFLYPYFEQLGPVLEYTILIKQVKTRETGLFLASDLKQYDQEGKILLWVFISFLLGKVRSLKNIPQAH